MAADGVVVQAEHLVQILPQVLPPPPPPKPWPRIHASTSRTQS
jgi:hypothetical protein